MMRQMPTPTGVIFLIIFLIVSGCRPEKSGDDVSDLSPDLLLDRLKSTQSRLQDFKGSALVSIHFDGRRGRVSTRIRYRRPDHLKVYVQGGLQVIAVLSLKNQDVQLYLPQENVVFEGTLGQTDALMPGLQVPLSDIRTASTGLVDLTPYVSEHITEYRLEDDRYRMSLTDGDRKRTLWIDPERSVVIREEEQTADGKTIVRSFDQYTRKEGIWRPSRIHIESDVKDETLDLKYDMQSLNSGLTNADLRMTLPKSIRRLPLSDMIVE